MIKDVFTDMFMHNCSTCVYEQDAIDIQRCNTCIEAKREFINYERRGSRYGSLKM